MYLQRKSDGAIVPDIAAAVKAYMCPGPCSPDCLLYPVHQLDETGGYVHMCHESYYQTHLITVADALGYRVIFADPPPASSPPLAKPSPLYLAVIKASAVRDAQFCTNAELDPMDDDAWVDAQSPELFLDFFSGDDKDEVLRRAAEYGCTVTDNIRLIPVPRTGRS